MSQLIHALLIEDNVIEARQTQYWLSKATEARFEVHSVDRLDDGLDRLRDKPYDIVLLDLNLPDSRGLETFTRLKAQHPNVPVVVLTGEIDAEAGVMAVAQGAEDYLVKQQVDGPTLCRVLRYAIVRHRAQAERASKSSIPAAPGRVFGFLGAKGGVGTTTVALNVAAALAQKGKSVVLVELRPSFGSLAYNLHIEPAACLSTLLQLPPERIHRNELVGVLSQGSGSVRVLFGPRAGEPVKEIEPGQAEAVINGLKELAEFVILDLPGEPSAASQAAARLCQFMGLVTDCEPASIHCGSVVVERLGQWGVSSALVGAIVVNRTVVPVMMSLTEACSQLGCKIAQVVPPAGAACYRAQEEGLPLVLSQPASNAAIALTEAANRLAADRVAGIAA